MKAQRTEVRKEDFTMSLGESFRTYCSKCSFPVNSMSWNYAKQEWTEDCECQKEGK